MGIDYVVKSKNTNIFNDEMQLYIKYALKDIEWFKILELLNINLGALYSNSINYWAPEQVKDMYKSIKLLYDDPYNSLCEGFEEESCFYEKQEEVIMVESMKDDVKKLLDYFEILVKNEAYIYVF